MWIKLLIKSLNFAYWTFNTKKLYLYCSFGTVKYVFRKFYTTFFYLKSVILFCNIVQLLIRYYSYVPASEKFLAISIPYNIHLQLISRPSTCLFKFQSWFIVTAPLLLSEHSKRHKIRPNVKKNKEITVCWSQSIWFPHSYIQRNPYSRYLYVEAHSIHAIFSYLPFLQLRTTVLLY